MKRLFTIIIALIAMASLGAGTAGAQITSGMLAFPGADGYGKYTTGGRGGEVCYVTRLDDCSDNNLVPGTLRWAIRHDNGGKPRTVLFKVSGTIYLTSKLRFQYSDVSILGQSAPGGGICLSGYNMYISKDNVIVRYIRFRAGDIPNSSMTGLDIENVKNVILDHCSMTWSMEECLTAYDTKYTTVQWCILGEGLYNSKNSKGARAYAAQWGGEHSSMHHTLITNSHSRSPRFNGARDAGSGHDTYVDSEFANNVVFNWSGTNAIYGGEMKTGVEGYNRVYMINNYYRPGPSTKQNGTKTHFASPSSPYGEWYANGNMFEESGTFAPWTAAAAQAANADNTKALNSLPSDKIIPSIPYDLSGMEYATAEAAFNDVVTKAGASLPRYDEVDTRLLAEAKGTQAPQFTGSLNEAGIIDSPDDVKLTNHDTYLAASAVYTNYPYLGMLDGDKYAKDSDGDGMPDAYEDAKGLNKSDATDGAADSGNGYTNLEIYLNGIADGTINKADYETELTPDIAGTEQTLPATAGGKTYTGYFINAVYYPAGTKVVVPEGVTPTPVVTVSFNYEGIAPMLTTTSAKIKMPSAEKDGYTFKGWSDGTNTYDAGLSYLFVSCITLEPLFEKNAGLSGKGTATVKWEWKGTQDIKGAQEPNGIFDPATSAISSKLTAVNNKTMKINNVNKTFFGVQPAVQINVPDDENYVEFYMQPYSGMTFKLTNISFNTARFGTDGGKVDVRTKIGDAEEVVRQEGIVPARDNSGNCTAVNIDVTDAEATSSAIVVRMYLYSLGNTKQVGFSDVTITGEWEGTAKEATKYKFYAVCSPAEGGTITQSPAGTEFVEDTKITVNAKENSDYLFVGWTDSEGNEYTKNQNFTYVLTGNASFTANFRAVSSYTDVFKEGSPYDAECRDAQELKIALKAAAKSTASRYRIFLHDGLYDLGNTILTTVPKNVSLIGESETGVTIANTAEQEGIGSSATLLIEKNISGIYMQDITLLNRLDYGAPTTAFAGRAVCLQDKGTKNAYKNVTLHSNQDTYYANNGGQKAYWETSTITGTVDYICGDGAVWFEQCTLFNNARGGGDVIVAPNTQVGAANWGFVFNGCTVDGDEATQAGKYSLGRPWNESPHATFINTTFNILPQAKGWTVMGDGKVCRFHEYGSKDKDGNPLDLSTRSLEDCKPAAGSDPCVVDATFAAKYTVDAVCGTGWDPKAMCQQLTAPAVTLNGGTLSWAAVDGAYCYAIVKDGSVVGFTTSTSYTVDDASASYAIRVANQMGGLGAASGTVTAINNVTADSITADTRMFNIAGQRVTAAHHGIVIQGGKKMVK